MVSIYNGLVLCYKEWQIHNVCRKMHTPGKYNVKENKPDVQPLKKYNKTRHQILGHTVLLHVNFIHEDFVQKYII